MHKYIDLLVANLEISKSIVYTYSYVAVSTSNMSDVHLQLAMVFATIIIIIIAAIPCHIYIPCIYLPSCWRNDTTIATTVSEIRTSGVPERSHGHYQAGAMCSRYGPCERSKSWPTSLPAFGNFLLGWAGTHTCTQAHCVYLPRSS